MSKVVSIVGAQWGDEGKGRMIDYLAQSSQVVIRFQGGDNAGHTVINDKGKFALHIIPSGIFNPDTMNIVGAGTVVNFDTMAEELASITKAGVEVDNLFIDVRAHLIMPYHRQLDGAQERSKSEKAQIGTTGRGIGPCYSDKATRSGLRAGDLHDLERARTRLEMLLPQKNRELAFYGLPEADIDELMSLLERWAKTYRDKIIDTLPVVRDAYETGQKILLEGQLGVMRDLDWGIYPYTTSSSPTSGGAAVGRRRKAPLNRKGVRSDDRPAPPVRLVRCGGHGVLLLDQRLHCPRPDQAGRAGHLRDDQDLHRVHDRRGILQPPSGNRPSGAGQTGL